jgi:CRP/FNR family transcriptional regulator, cyclic AMP receptor protein
MSKVAAEELTAIGLFDGISPAELAKLAERAVPRRLAAGQLLFTAGEPSEHLVLVRRGRLRVLVSSERGDELVLTVLGAGDVLGELSVFDELPRSAGVEALDDAEVLLLPATAVRSVVVANPTALLAVTQQLAGQVRRLTGSAADLVFLDLPRRLAKLVLARAADGRVADLGVSQSGLAAQLGTTRQSVNKALSGLAARGWISASGAQVTVLDEPALRRFSTS